MTDPLYTAWIKFLFDRPDDEGEKEWYWNLELEDFSASPEEKVVLIAKTFERSGTDLSKYSDIQVTNGLSYITNNIISDTVFSLFEESVPERLRIQATSQIKHLYEDCLAIRCKPVLSHLDESGSNPLNGYCYMLWDSTPLSLFNDIVLDVIEDALYLPNDACIESALHGLGHRSYQNEERVHEIIEKFLSEAKSLRPELRKYAQKAKVGNVL